MSSHESVVVEAEALDPTLDAARDLRERNSMGSAFTPGHSPEALWGGQTVTLASVYPAPLTARFNWGGHPLYRIDPPPDGGVSLLHVGGTYQLVRDVSAPEIERQMPAPIYPMQVAESLMQKWVQGALGSGSGLSIGVGIVPRFGKRPTPEFVRKLRESQQAYFQYLVNLADTHYHRQEFRMIADQHRMAAVQIGAVERPWFTATSQEGLKHCYGCGQRITKQSLVCQHCGQNLPVLYYTLGEVPPREDEAVFRAYQTYKARVEGNQEKRATDAGNAFRSAMVAVQDLNTEHGEAEDLPDEASSASSRTRTQRGKGKK